MTGPWARYQDASEPDRAAGPWAKYGGNIDEAAALAQKAAQNFRMPGQGAESAIDPNKPAMPPAEPVIAERAAMLPWGYDAQGKVIFPAWPQIAVDVGEAANRLGNAARVAVTGEPAAPAETFPQPQDAILASLAIEGPLAMPRPAPALARTLPSSQRAAQMAEDLAAHERANVPVFAPAFGKAPTKMVAKGLSEVYGIGAPLQYALENTYSGMAERAGQIANQLAPAATYDSAGAALQAGLDRYKTAGVRRIDPGVLAERGIEPLAPVQREEIMARGAANRAAEAAPIRQVNQGGTAQTARGVEVPAARGLDQTILARRGAADLSDVELDALIRARADETSFGVRSEALYEHADRQLPPQMRINETANPQLLAPVNTQRAIAGMRAEAERTRIPGGVVNGRYAGLAERVRTNVTLPTLRAMRTAVGRDLANFSYGETGLDRTQLNTLYRALSRDQEIAYQDLANRAHIQSRVSPNRPDYVSPQTARAADRALYEFRRADRYFRQGIERMDTFLNVVKASRPEAAAQKMITAATEGGKGDMRMFTNAMSALRPEERQQFASLVIREMGKPIPSARGIAQDVGFSPSSFTTRATKMDQRAFDLIFPGEHGRAVRDLIQIANRLANVERFENVSGSGRMSVNVTGILAGIASLSTGNIVPAVAAAGSGWTIAAMLSHPAYARWLVNYARFKAAGARGERAITSLIGQLASYAAGDHRLVPLYRAALLENGIATDPSVDEPGR